MCIADCGCSQRRSNDPRSVAHFNLFFSATSLTTISGLFRNVSINNENRPPGRQPLLLMASRGENPDHGTVKLLEICKERRQKAADRSKNIEQDAIDNLVKNLFEN